MSLHAKSRMARLEEQIFQQRKRNQLVNICFCEEVQIILICTLIYLADEEGRIFILGLASNLSSSVTSKSHFKKRVGFMN